jgi:5-methylcytosine-specific restriction protein A
MSQLSEIEPKKHQRLIDLVEAAGVNVSDWGNFKGGEKYASRNPKYCYEWAFVEPKKVAVFNLWHDGMEERPDGFVFKQLDVRNFASLRSGIESVRALRMDEAIQTAVKDKLQIRIVVLGGRIRDINNPTEKASHVSKRLLDPVSWSVTAYNWETGECTLTRGVNQFVDQFSIPKESPQKPERREVTGLAFIRSPVVRGNVLLRANGKCEWCGEPGFLMADGRIYLETHHVIPLSEAGSDIESNVSALCPNHHREAHHGADKVEMRKKLLKRIAE